jgi:hypothetical protein
MGQVYEPHPLDSSLKKRITYFLPIFQNTAKRKDGYRCASQSLETCHARDMFRALPPRTRSISTCRMARSNLRTTTI